MIDGGVRLLLGGWTGFLRLARPQFPPPTPRIRSARRWTLHLGLFLSHSLWKRKLRYSCDKRLALWPSRYSVAGWVQICPGHQGATGQTHETQQSTMGQLSGTHIQGVWGPRQRSVGLSSHPGAPGPFPLWATVGAQLLHRRPSQRPDPWWTVVTTSHKYSASTHT